MHACTRSAVEETLSPHTFIQLAATDAHLRGKYKFPADVRDLFSKMSKDHNLIVMVGKKVHGLAELEWEDIAERQEILSYVPRGRAGHRPTCPSVRIRKSDDPATASLLSCTNLLLDS